MQAKLFLVLFLGGACITQLLAEDDNSDDFLDAGNAEAGDDVEESELEAVKDEYKEENDVLVLSEDNFDHAISDHDIMLVEFYAPWCGHCKSLAPRYEKAAAKLKENKPPVALAKVDATEESSLAERFEVSGYPTLVFFKNGEHYPYEGPREEDGIVSFMQEIADPSWKPPPPPSAAVVTLTQANFTDFVNDHDLSLVEFYAPWCGHCKKLTPEYEKAATDLLKNDPPIPLAKVDATQENDLASQYGVSGYPTLKMFRKGKEYEYNGERQHYGIVRYMKDQVGDASKEKDSCKDLQKSLKPDDVTVVAFFDSKESPEFQVYAEAANIQRENYVFVHSFDSKCREQFKVNANTIILSHAERFHTKFEPKRHPLEVKEGTTATEIVDFIKSRDVPLVGEFNPDTQTKRYADKRPLVLVFYMVDFGFQYRDATQLWRKKVAAIAKDFKDVTFAVADEDKNKEVFKSFGFEDSGEDLNIAIFGEKDQKFPMEPMEEFDSDEIRSFLKNFQKGKLKPHLKSQAVPKKQSGPVTVLVAKNFDKIVNDPEKDVLVEFYAPWCGHCKQLEPKFKQLAKKYKDEKNLVIAKMDATANDVVPPFEVSGFPTIFFSPAGKKDSPLKYEENARDVEDFVKFLEENVKNSLGKSLKDEL